MPYIFKGMYVSLLSASDTDGDRNIQCPSLASPFALLSVLTESEVEKIQDEILLNTIITTTSSVFL